MSVVRLPPSQYEVTGIYPSREDNSDRLWNLELRGVSHCLGRSVGLYFTCRIQGFTFTVDSQRFYEPPSVKRVRKDQETERTPFWVLITCVLIQIQMGNSCA